MSTDVESGFHYYLWVQAIIFLSFLLSFFFVVASPKQPPVPGRLNDLSDMEDETQAGQKPTKLSDIYSTTIPSVDSAVESWDGSAIDATFSSQGKFELFQCFSAFY